MEFVPVLLVFVLYFSGIPIAYALLSSAFFYFGVLNPDLPAERILNQFIDSIQSFSFLAIPFFVMAGSITGYAGISTRLLRFSEALAGHLPGGLAQVNVVLSMLMGGVSGSANADAAMQCTLLVPEMERRGYSKGFSAAITAASSAVTPVIPPGINLIVYALLVDVSLGKMFTAGYLPGILMALCLMLVVHIISKKRNYAPIHEKPVPMSEVLKLALDSSWALFFPFGIILGLWTGLFSPPEAGAVAVLYCILIGIFVYQELKLAHIPVILRETIEGTSGIALIIAAASVFGYYLACEQIPQLLADCLLRITRDKDVMLMLINILLLLLGMFMEGGVVLIVLAPLLCPVVSGLGVDPVHFGLICIVNTIIGGLTPPFGSMMFTCCYLTGCRLWIFVKECFPFIVVLLAALFVVTYVPGLTMLIPNLLY